MSLIHYQQLVDAAKRLAERGIEVYEHHYNNLAFGSWTVIAGKRHEQVRFVWDGRDGFLTISEASFSDSRSTPAWNTVKQTGINTQSGHEVWQVVVDFLATKFAV